MRRIAAAACLPLLLALAVAGCGGSSSAASPNGSVTVSGTFGKTPKVTIPAQKAGKNLVYKTEIQGTGPALGKDDSFVGNYVVYKWSGTKHTLALSTFSSSPQLLSGSLLPGLATALKDKKMGSRVLAVLPPKYGYGPDGNTEVGVTGTDTLVFVIDMIKEFGDKASASGTQVSNGGGDLPTVTAKPGSAPTITVPAKKSPPSKLVVKTLIRGSGAKVAKGQEVITQYVAVNWRTKKVFDSSWSRDAPFGFEIDANPPQIIPGWDKGLLGVPVGSRVMLIIPPADGYGKSGDSEAGIKGTDTLVFVVDVIGAVNSNAS
jgi:FKBP-type peptidyl-prolyl cis-trans isomerase